MEYLHHKVFQRNAFQKPATMPHEVPFECRISEALLARAAKAEPKKMFGGVAFMVRGHMTVGITNKGDLMVRFDGTRRSRIGRAPSP